MKQWWWLVPIALLTGLGAGWALWHLLPPLTVTDPFWADFATSPAMGGLFGIAGALIALTAAGVAATVSRISARRGEWWDRAEWALQLAISGVSREREAGLSALRILAREATKNEGEMIDAVTSVYVADLDGASEQAENGHGGGAADVEQEGFSDPA